MDNNVRYHGGKLLLPEGFDSERLHTEHNRILADAIYLSSIEHWKFNAIPEQLKAINHWILWGKRTHRNMPQTKVEKDLEKLTKELKAPDTVKPRGNNGVYVDSAAPNQPQTWSSYESAVNGYNTGFFNGIGFVFTKSNFFGVDLDHCLDPDLSINNDTARTIVEKSKAYGFYIEVTPSGDGLHIIGTGQLPFSGHKNAQVEAYDGLSNRYLTMTGRLLYPAHPGDVDIDGAEFLNWLGEFAFKKEERPTAPTPAKTTQATVYQGFDAISAFNAAHDVRAILIAHGYREDGDRFTAPQSESGMPGVSIMEDGRVYSHHNNDPLNTGRAHDAFSLFTILEYNGDTKAAARAAREMFAPLQPRRERTPPPANATPHTQPTTHHAPPPPDHPDAWIDFWEYDDKTKKLSIVRPRWVQLIANLGYRRFFETKDSKNSILVKVVDNKIDIAVVEEIKDDIERCIKARQMDELAEEMIFNKIMSSKDLFSPHILGFLPVFYGEIAKCNQDTCFFYVRNGIVEIKKDSVKLIPYGENGKTIWKSKVLDRHYSPMSFDEFMKGDIPKFCWYLAGEDHAAFKSLMILIGYMLHTHKDPIITKVAILTDKKISNKPQGRSGKSNIIKIISQIRQVDTIDGKLFDPKHQFGLQNARRNSDAICFDDFSAKFNLLFQMVTGVTTIEEKGFKAVQLPYDISPKFFITTNEVVGEMSSSYMGRMSYFEVSDRYSDEFSPYDDFGRRFFDDWEKDDPQWNYMINFLISCEIAYLNNINDFRLNKTLQPDSNINRKMLIKETSDDFVGWVEDTIKPLNEYNKKELYNQYLEYIGDEKRQRISPKRFHGNLTAYAEYLGMILSTRPSNGLQMVSIIEKPKGRNK